jgi:hypothetical protein
MTSSPNVPPFSVGAQVTVLVGSKTGYHAAVESISWSDRDHCHYFYLTQPDRKLSRGYRANELAPAGHGSSVSAHPPPP